MIFFLDFNTKSNRSKHVIVIRDKLSTAEVLDQGTKFVEGKAHKSIFSSAESFGRFFLTPQPPLQSVHPPKSIFLKDAKRNLRPINFQFADADLRCVFLLKLVLPFGLLKAAKFKKFVQSKIDFLLNF